MSTTNGIDLSPDGKTLYVGESDTREIWAYGIDGAQLVAARLVKQFNDFDIDGLRTDTAGNLLVARILKGTIAVLTPEGKVEREISLRQGADQPRLRRQRTERRFLSPSARVASSNRFAPIIRAANSVCGVAAGRRKNR